MLKTYAFHRPGSMAAETVAVLRKSFSMLHELLLATVPNSRERACALTNLETAAMWATKGVVINDPESVVVGEEVL